MTMVALGSRLPVIPLRGYVLLPGGVLRITVGATPRCAPARPLSVCLCLSLCLSLLSLPPLLLCMCMCKLHSACIVQFL